MVQKTPKIIHVDILPGLRGKGEGDYTQLQQLSQAKGYNHSQKPQPTKTKQNIKKHPNKQEKNPNQTQNSNIIWKSFF